MDISAIEYKILEKAPRRIQHGRLQEKNKDLRQKSAGHEFHQTRKELERGRERAAEMQRQAISKPARCFPSSVPTLLYPLFFAIFMSPIIIVTHIASPFSVFTTSHDLVALSPSIQNHVSHLQSQVGLLLKQLHTEEGESKIVFKYFEQVLAIAVSLDKLSDALSHLYQASVAEWNNMSTVEFGDFSQTGEEDEDEEGLLTHQAKLNSDEFYNYTSPKPNRYGKKNFLGVDTVNPSVGSACASLASDVERFMAYTAYGSCPDDWILAQKLMVAGCDPLPRRRCFSKSPPHYTKPLPVNSSLWNLPDDKNVLWTHYKCKRFSCLVSKEFIGKRGFFKCADCFNLTSRGWEVPINESVSAEFTIDEVLQLKPGEIRIGLDFSPTTGNFAAIMRERNVNIATATLNLGAPYNEVIAQRGLLPLYVSVGSRFPFFDNTLDIVHSTLFLDGWIGIELLQYVLLDWDRVLRPKGILWIDRFFCSTDDMALYLKEFEKLKYKKLLWRVVPKTDKLGDELFFSAILEKPLRY